MRVVAQENNLGHLGQLGQGLRLDAYLFHPQAVNAQACRLAQNFFAQLRLQPKQLAVRRRFALDANPHRLLGSEAGQGAVEVDVGGVDELHSSDLSLMGSVNAR